MIFHYSMHNLTFKRVKMCTEITHEDLVTVHHEMGHIQYFMEYAHQPYIYRNGGNPGGVIYHNNHLNFTSKRIPPHTHNTCIILIGFHEAIGDTMALAVVTPKHLEKIGLLEKGQTEENEDVHLVNGQKISKNDITYLFRNALEKVVFFKSNLL